MLWCGFFKEKLMQAASVFLLTALGLVLFLPQVPVGVFSMEEQTVGVCIPRHVFFWISGEQKSLKLGFFQATKKDYLWCLLCSMQNLIIHSNRNMWRESTIHDEGYSRTIPYHHFNPREKNTEHPTFRWHTSTTSDSNPPTLVDGQSIQRDPREPCGWRWCFS